MTHFSAIGAAGVVMDVHDRRSPRDDDFQLPAINPNAPGREIFADAACSIARRSACSSSALDVQALHASRWQWIPGRHQVCPGPNLQLSPASCTSTGTPFTTPIRSGARWHRRRNHDGELQHRHRARSLIGSGSRTGKRHGLKKDGLPRSRVEIEAQGSGADGR